MLKKKRFVIGGIIILLAIGYLAFVGFQQSATYYYTVSEFAGKASEIPAKNVKVSGQVAPGSVQQDSGRTLKFDIEEGGKSIAVVYQGGVPDAFQEGNEVVCEGHLNSEGVFLASSIMTKCPSKYMPQT